MTPTLAPALHQVLASRAPLAAIKPDLDNPNPKPVLRSVISHVVASTLNLQLDTLAHTLGQTTTLNTDNVFHDSLIPTGHSLPGEEACSQRRITFQGGSKLPFTKPSQEDLSKTKPFPMQAAELSTNSHYTILWRRTP